MTRSRHNGYSDHCAHCAFPVPLWLKKYQLVALIKSGIRRIINGYLKFKFSLCPLCLHCAFVVKFVPLWLKIYHHVRK